MAKDIITQLKLVFKKNRKIYQKQKIPLIFWYNNLFLKLDDVERTLRKYIHIADNENNLRIAEKSQNNILDLS